jgi:hypothetical protein
MSRCQPCQAHLRGEALPFSAANIAAITAAGGDVSRELGGAEREVERYWTAECLRQHWQRLQQRLRQQRLQQTTPSEQQQPEQQLGAAVLEGLPATVLGWVRPEISLAAVTLEEFGMETVIKVRGWSGLCAQARHVCTGSHACGEEGRDVQQDCGPFETQHLCDRRPQTLSLRLTLRLSLGTACCCSWWTRSPAPASTVWAWW